MRGKESYFLSYAMQLSPGELKVESSLNVQRNFTEDIHPNLSGICFRKMVNPGILVNQFVTVSSCFVRPGRRQLWGACSAVLRPSCRRTLTNSESTWSRHVHGCILSISFHDVATFEENSKIFQLKPLGEVLVKFW